MTEPTTPLRVANMRKRRERILAEARGLITRRGFESLNLRELARLAEVTVPTIYNLLGNKEEVLVALFEGVLGEIDARMQGAEADDALAQATVVVTASTGLFAEDEDYYRSAFLAVEYLNQSGEHHDKVAQIYAWGERMASAGFVACRDAGLLAGRIAPERLGEAVLRGYRTSCRAWAFGLIDLARFRRDALVDIYIALAADASSDFHAELVKHIAAHAAADPGPATNAPADSKEHAR